LNTTTKTTLTEEQTDIVDQIIEGIENGILIQTLGGYAGTGKTTLVATLHELLPNFAVCAFTGKAATVLGRKGIADTSTIHSRIYKPVTELDGSVSFELRHRFEMNGIEGFLVDEASMVSRSIYEDLLSFKLPIVFVGDHGQLEPVGSDINVMANPMYRLETIHRNAGEIARFAEHLREGKLANHYQSKGKVKIMYGHRKMAEWVQYEADQMICAFNATRVSFNDLYREAAGRSGLVEPGERVICLRNNRQSGVYNGQQGIVKTVKLSKKIMTVDMEGVGEVELEFCPEQFGQEKPLILQPYHVNLFDYGYCITAHKSQGSEWGRVVVKEERCNKWNHVRWSYTAASRAKDELIWIG